MSIPGEVTPHRHTVADLYRVDDRVMVRPFWTERRHASEISRAPSDRWGASTGVLYVPGDAWILKPHQGDLPRVVETEYAGSIGGVDATAGLGGAIGNVNVAPGVTVENRYADPGRFTGVPVDPDVTQPDWTIKRRPGPSGDFSEGRLAADEIAYPPLPTDTAHTPMDRIAVGRETVPPNQPWALVFFVPETNADNLLNFYFGGPVDTNVAGHPGGEFGANFRANGELILWERDTAGGDWPAQPVFRFQTTAPGLGASVAYSYQLIPYYRDRLAIFSAAAETVLGTTGYLGAPYGGMAKAGRAGSLYRELRFTAGHRHATYMTGAGVFRADRARQDRTPLRVIKLRYPPSGTLIDLPFFIDHPVPDLTVILLRINATVPAGAALVGTIHNAATGLPLIADGVGRFLLTSGQRQYYVRFTFTRGTNNQTPILWDYQVEVDSYMEAQAPEVVTVECNQADGISITGGGTDPAQASAHFVVADLFQEADLLKTRGRIKTRIKTRYDPADEDLYSTLFMGETAPDGVDQFPRMQEGVGIYSRYDVPCGPMWNRIADQVVTGAEDFSKDPAYTGPDPGVVGWKFVHILKHLFTGAGVLADEQDIEEAVLGDLRVHVSTDSPADDYKLLQSQKYAVWITTIARGYLDAFVLYDPNAGTIGLDGEPRGMWRVLPQPAAPYTPLMRFALGPDPGTAPPVAVHHAAAYGENATFILRDSYRIRCVPPEANHVLAIGGAGLIFDTSGATLRQSMTNYASFHATPTSPLPDINHPDYLGRSVGIMVVDLTARRQESVNYLCWRVYDRACHAHQHHHFRAPLVLVTDPADPHQQRPRPLRAGDAVLIPADYEGGSKVGIVADVPLIDIQSDTVHWADYEIVAVNFEAEEEEP